MLRYLFSLSCIFSLLLSVSTGVLWVRQFHSPVAHKVRYSYERSRGEDRRPVATVLRREVPECRAIDARLDEVIDFFGDIGAIRITVDWKALKAVGLYPETTI